MRIVVAGGTGMLGTALVARLRQAGHAVTVLTRHARAAGEVAWSPDGSTGPWAAAVDDADAVVNLAGASIAGGRWTAARKQQLTGSRVLPTRSLARAIAAAPTPPRALLNASAVGIYGPHGDEIVTEQTPPGPGFLGRLAAAWEAEAERAASDRTRVVLLRSGLVLTRRGGLLARMRLPFRLGLGGPLGDGQQYMPWIQLDDWTSLVTWLIERPEGAGPFNVTAPVPVTNAVFARTLGRVLHRPAFARVPAVVLRGVLGELSEALLTGQRVVPARALAAGFAFEYPGLEAALRHELQRP